MLGEGRRCILRHAWQAAAGMVTTSPAFWSTTLVFPACRDTAMWVCLWHVEPQRS